MASGERGPDLSVVLITPDSMKSVRRTVAHLEAQTARDRMEIVVVGLKGFASAPADTAPENLRVVEVEAPLDPPAARVAGIRAASAPVVALAEDHAFPDAEWAEALISSYVRPWAAVGPVVYNANPVNGVSWADLVIGYGPWLEPTAGGPVDHLPGHNSSYRRDLLLGYGDERLAERLAAESVLHWEMRADGHRLLLQPAARLAHTNFAMYTPWIAALYHSGRLFGAERAGGWRLGKRLFFGGGSPLIPAVRLWRLRGAITRARASGAPRHLLALVAFGLAVDGLGQAAGYLFGEGGSRQKLPELEFHRERYARLDRLPVAP